MDKVYFERIQDFAHSPGCARERKRTKPMAYHRPQPDPLRAARGTEFASFSQLAHAAECDGDKVQRRDPGNRWTAKGAEEMHLMPPLCEQRNPPLRNRASPVGDECQPHPLSLHHRLQHRDKDLCHPLDVELLYGHVEGVLSHLNQPARMAQSFV